MDRHPLILTRQSTGLLIIDVQDKFKPVIPDIDDVVENITKLILAFQMYEMPVIVTEQYPKGLGNTIEIIEEQFKFIEIIEKLSFSCCGEPEFVKQMEKLSLKTVVVTGVETHVCVNQTVLDLLHAGYRVHVIADAVSSRHKTDYEIALRKMEKAGAVLGTTEMCLFELTEQAGTDGFRNISRLVKGRLRDLHGHTGTVAPHGTSVAAGAPVNSAAKPADTEKRAGGNRDKTAAITTAAQPEQQSMPRQAPEVPIPEQPEALSAGPDTHETTAVKQEIDNTQAAGEELKEAASTPVQEEQPEGDDQPGDFSKELGIDLNEIDKLIASENEGDKEKKE